MGIPKETIRIVEEPKQGPLNSLLSRKTRRIGTLSLHRAPVDETLKMLAEMGRFNVVFPGELGNRSVSLALHDVTVGGAFQAVLASARLDARLIADNIIEVFPKGAPTATNASRR